MKTQGKVNRRLFSKTELADQKVELAIMDDIEDALSMGFGMEDFIEDEIAKARMASMKASDAIKFDMNQFIGDAEEKINEAEQALKELGADSPKLNGYKSQLSKLEGLRNDLKRRADQLF